MSDPLLNYHTYGAPGVTTRLTSFTCVYLIILSGLYFLVGGCGTTSLTVLAFSPPPGMMLLIPVGLFIVVIVFFALLTFGSSGVFLWSALRLRKLSPLAALIGLILACVNCGLALAYDTFNAISYARMPAGSMPPGGQTAAVGSLVLYLLAALANALAALLLILVRRQIRQMRSMVPTPANPA